jgi:3-oxoacyl-[acyl-carrier-protein] synthase II
MVPVKITGLGILNALGVGKTAYWRQLLNGSSGISLTDRLVTPARKAHPVAEIRDFDPKSYMPPRFYRRLSRLSRLAVAASIEAVLDSGLEISDDNRTRTGAVFGTAFGSTHQTDSFFVSLLENGPQGAEPILFPDTVPNAPASHVAIYHQLQGPNSTFCQNHLSGESAVAFAISLLELGRADTLLVGGVDELSDILLHSLDAVGALKSIPSAGPYQSHRIVPGKGFIPGEGATCLVLERDDTRGRDRKQAYGLAPAIFLTGAQTQQGHYETAGDGIAVAIKGALEQAELRADDIDIIGLAANGVDELEDAEARALEKVFGLGWYKVPRIPLRYFVGDFGSAGILSAATILMALIEGIVPPHIQGKTLTGVPGDPDRFAQAKRAVLCHGMVIGSTFGGGCSCLVVSRHR